MSPKPHPSAQLVPTAGSYRLERRLGRGATGDVWLGRHQSEGSIAAIKLLRSRARADGDTIAVLEREFRVIARLDHPHIVSVVEIGEQHVALQYIEGTTLARRLTKPMSFSLIQRIALQILRRSRMRTAEAWCIAM